MRAKSSHNPHSRPLIEELEPRVLYSADLAPGFGPAAPGLPQAEYRPLDETATQDWNWPQTLQTSEAQLELVVVDSRVEDADSLLAALTADGTRRFEIIRLDADHDGVDQLNWALASYHDVAAIHILAHGEAGRLQLGSGWIDGETLHGRADEVFAWRESLTANADILIYGCDVAAGDAGSTFVAMLADYTGADVAASTDLTGNTGQGGDWVLEYQYGQIESRTFFGERGVPAWQGVLANTAPVITLPASVAVTQDSSVTFTGANTITLVDAEAGTGPVRLELTATQGVLELRPVVGSEFQVNTTTASNQQAPRIAVAADGHYVVVWQSNNQDGSKLGVYARVYNADGTARSGEIAVNTTTNDDQSLPSIAIDASGRFVVAWQSYDTARLTWDIYARSFDANGTALSGQKRITTDADDQIAPAVAMDGSGNVVIVYQSRGQDNADGNWGIYARTANATLSNINAELRVNTTTLNAQTAPTVAGGTSGFVIAWQSAAQDGSGTGIYAQRFNASGGTVGGEVRINTTTAGDQSAPSLAMNTAGEFTVAWQSASQDGSGWAVVARCFDAAGNALGNEVLVNTTSAGDQTDPSVALTSDSRFAVTWTSVGQDNADGKAGVYLRAFDGSGSALSDETLVNAATADVQSTPSVGIASDGRMVAVWQSNRQDGNGYGVFGQRLLQPGALHFVSGDGVADSALAFTGTLADLNAALLTLRYTPNAGYWGPAGLTVVANDLGSGEGPALGTMSSLAIDVQKINVGPTTTVPGAQATAEDTPIVFSAATGNAITVADPDADPDPVQVTLSAADGTLQLSTTAGLTFVGGANGTVSMVVRGRLADLNSALDGLVYRPNTNFSGADTLTVVTDDLGHNTVGGPYTATGTVALTIAARNDAPVNQLPSSAGTIENTTLVLSAANGNQLRIADVDAGTGNLEVTLLSTNGTLMLSRTTSLSFIVGTGKGGEDQITFRGKLVDINAALDGMSFTPLAGYAGPAFIEMLSNDLGNSGAGGALGDSDLLEITVAPNATNAAPVITVPPNQTTTEEKPITLSTAGGNGISVVDDAGGQLLQVTLTVTDGTLTLDTTTGGEFQVNSTVGNDQQAQRVAMMPGGGHVVVWQSTNQDGGAEGIYLQRYSDEGLPLGPEQRVNTTTDGAQHDPAVAVADDGSFVVVWTSDGQDGSGKGVYGQRLAADGTAIGGEFRVNVMTAGDQMSPSVAADATGNFVVVWQSKDQDGEGWGVFARRYAANGTALGGEFLVNTTTAKDQSAPVVAMADAGSFIVAWQSVRQDGSNWGVFAQRFDADGVAAGSEFRVSTITYKDQAMPAIAADSAGNFVVAWQSKDIDYNDDRFGIYAQRYFADGSALGSQFLVNTRTPGDQTAPAVAMDNAGNFVIVWQSKGQDLKDDPAGIYAQRYTNTGARQGGEFRVNTTVADAQTAPALAMSNTGRMLVVWTSDKQDGAGLGVYGQRYIDARSLGFSVGDGFDDATMTFTGTLDQINEVLDGLVYAPATNFDGKATLTATVDDLGHSGTGGAKVSSKSFQITVAGVNDAPSISVPTVQTVVEGPPAVFSVAGGRAITIADPDAGTKNLFVTLTAPTGTLTLATIGGLQFILGDGAADASMIFTGTVAEINAALDGLTLTLPTRFTGEASVQVYVNDQANTGTGGALSDQAVALITVVPDSVNAAPVVSVPPPQRTAVDTSLTLAATRQNAINVVDDSGNSPVRVTVTVTNGTVTLDSRVGAQAIANFSILGDQTEARIAMLPGGSTIVVWTSSIDGNGSGVYAQRFDASGARIGAEWRVNATVAGNQHAPAIAADAAGGFVIAWVSDVQDGSGRGVYFQRYDANGQALGTETRANTTISGDQTAPAVAITSSGAFVVVWQSDDANGEGVFVQRFDANGEPAGAETQVNVATAGDQQLPAVAMDAVGNFVVVWQGRDSDGEGILARRFDAAGNGLGSEFIVNAAVSDKQLAPALAMNAAGDWVVAWESPDANGSGIFGQRFNAAGATVGSQFAVNTTTGGNQIAPAVAINDSGAFVVAWQSADANNQGVFAQAFAADGSAAGSEQLVNTTTAGNQIAPSVGIMSDGTYCVVWTGDNQDLLGKGIGMQSMLRADAVTFIAGDGVDDATMTFTAQLADVNAMLDGMRFTPTTGFVGVANVAVSVDDLGASGSGGARVGSGDVDIVVGTAPLIDLDANDSAGLQGADYRVNFNTSLGPVRVADADATLTDPNSGNLQGLTVTITNLLDSGAELLGFSTAGAITGSYSPATGVLTFTGTDTVARYQQVLRTVTYNNTAASPTTTVRQITFRATDGVGSFSNIATAYVSFSGANTAPTANNDAYSTIENQTLTVLPNGVLGNDTDAEFDALNAMLVSGAANGTLALAADGSFTYTPTPGFTGLDTFSYIANDGQASSNVATVTISIGALNTPPTGADNTLTMSEDGTLVLASADFGFGDAADSPANAFLGVRIATLPSAGTLSLYGSAISAGDIIQVDAIDNGGLTFTPAANANGAGYASFTFQVQDDGGVANGGVDIDQSPNTITVNVIAVNDATTTSPVTLAPIAEDSGAWIITEAQLLANANDVDGPSLTAANLAISAGNGTLVNNGNGTWTYTPALNDDTAVSFSYIVSDSSLSVAGSASLDITPVNDAPVLAPIGDQAVNEGTTLSFIATATDVDVQANALTYSLVDAAAGAVIDADTGIFSWTPTEGQGPGTYSFDVVVSDGLLTDSETINITVNEVNQAPAIASNGGGAAASVFVVENTTAVTTVAATDADLPVQTLTYSIVGGADTARFQIDANTGALSFVVAPDYENPLDANGDNVYEVTLQASDGNGGTDSQILNVVVGDVPNQLTVTTVQDVLDGDVSSVEALNANPGLDGAISLREAIMAANNTPGRESVSLPAGTYLLMRTGAETNNNPNAAINDLDVSGDLDIIGSGAAATVIDGGGIGRVFQIQSGTVDLSDVTVAGGIVAANDWGGGAYVESGATLTLSRAVFVGNSAGSGGGMYNMGTILATDSTFAGNTAGEWGGGLLNDGGTMTLERVTVSGNSAGRDGGGIYQYGQGATLALRNVTISGNTAVSQGGGLYSSRIVTAEHVTVAYNTAGTGGGIAMASPGSISLDNVLVGGNGATTSPDVVGGVTSLGHNLVGNTAGSSGWVAGDLLNVTPVLNTILAMNGGYTATHELLSGSPAINAGSTGSLAADQRGAPRVGTADIGAYEFWGTANAIPVITSDGGGATASITVAENASQVTTVAATDADSPAQTLGYSIVGGADAARFEIDGATGVLSFRVAPDFEPPSDAGADNVYDVVIQVGDGMGGTDTQSIAVSVADANETPTLSVPLIDQTATEGIAFSYTVPASTFADVDAADTLSYSTTAIPSWLTFNAGTRAFSGTPANGDIGVSTIAVRATDGGGLWVESQFTLTVAAVNTAPDIASNGGGATATITLPENTTAVTNVSGTDADVPGQALTYSISGGADAGKFQIHPNSGMLSFVSAPDFETPTDANGDNAYEVTVQVSDGSLTDSQHLSVAVTNQNETAVVTATLVDQSASANAAFSYTFGAGSFTDPDFGDSLTYSASGVPPWLTFDAATRTFSGTPTDGDVGASTINVRATDGGGLRVHDQFQLTVVAVNAAPIITSDGGAATVTISLAENGTMVTTVAATDADVPAQTLTYSIVGGADAGRFQIDANTGALAFVTAPDHEAPSDANGDNVYELTVQVSDGATNDTQQISLTISNVNEAPVLTANNLTITGEAGVTLTPANLGSTDVDSAPSSIIYSVASTSGGHFELAGQPGVAVTSFSPAQVSAGSVVFVSENAGMPPTYSILVSDGSASGGPFAAIVAFTPTSGPAIPTDARPSTTPPAEALALPAAKNASAPAQSSEAAPAETQPMAGDVGSFIANPAPSTQVILSAGTASSEQTWIVGAVLRPSANDTRAAALSPQLQDMRFALSESAQLQALDLLKQGMSSESYGRALDKMREAIESQGSFENVVVGTSVAVSGSLSIGYVLWLLRGGALVGSLLSALPAWTVFDPLPVLAYKSRDDDDEGKDDASERMFDKKKTKARRVGRKKATPDAAGSNDETRK
jgi:large repetitive protein